jgi:acryloyl-coenzyme A reductase
VRVDACAVAFRDILDRRGAFPFIKDDAVLGHEIAGTVVEVARQGQEEHGLAPGDRVVSLHWSQKEAWPSPLQRGAGVVASMLGISCDGGYADYCTADSGAFVKVPNPSKWTAIEAAPVMSTYGTVWQGAHERASLTGNDDLLVTGSSGGVGTAAVQLGKLLGCHVTGVTSNPNKVDYVRSLGADKVIVLDSKGQFSRSDTVKEMGGYDVCIECVGSPTFEQALRSLRPEGRLVLVGNVDNATAPLPLGLCILNSLSVVGSDSISAKALKGLFQLLDEHPNVRPRIDRVLPLEKAMEAHDLLERKAVTGRVVLQVSQDNWT